MSTWVGLLPGTGWIPFTQLMDLVCLMMDLLGKRVFPRGSLALLDFHTIRAVCDATISFRGRRPAFSNMDFEDTLSLRAVFVMVRATDLIDRFIFSVARCLFPSRSIIRPTLSINCGKATQPVPGNKTLAANLMARAWNSSIELQTVTTIGAARTVAQKWARNLLEY